MEDSDIEMAWETVGAFEESAEMAQDAFCANLTCIEMLGAMAAQVFKNDTTGATDAADDFLHDDDATNIASLALEDASEATGQNFTVFEQVLEADNVGQIATAAEQQLKEADVSDEDAWFGDVLDAFWRGFTYGAA